MLDGLLADRALLVDDLGALLAKDAVATRHHHSVDLAAHAHLAVVVSKLLLLLLLHHLWLLSAHHLVCRVDELLTVLLDRREKATASLSARQARVWHVVVALSLDLSHMVWRL